MMRKIVGPIHIGKILIGLLSILMVTSNLVRAASHLHDGSIAIAERGGNQEKIRVGFSSMSSMNYAKYDIYQSLRRDYSHSDVNSSYKPDTNNTTRVHQSESMENQSPPTRTIVNMKKNLEMLSHSRGDEQESRSFTVLHMFLKTLKNTLKILRPEIKLSECAQKYFFSTSETPSKPLHNHGHSSDHDKKKKKKKHKHDPDKHSDHITDGIVSSVFGLHSDFASIIYDEYKPYLHLARSVYKNLKSSYKTLRQDALVKCTVDYLVARFCIWVDG